MIRRSYPSVCHSDWYIICTWNFVQTILISLCASSTRKCFVAGFNTTANDWGWRHKSIDLDTRKYVPMSSHIISVFSLLLSLSDLPCLLSTLLTFPWTIILPLRASWYISENTVHLAPMSLEGCCCIYFPENARVMCKLIWELFTFNNLTYDAASVLERSAWSCLLKTQTSTLSRQTEGLSPVEKRIFCSPCSLFFYPVLCWSDIAN